MASFFIFQSIILLVKEVKRRFKLHTSFIMKTPHKA